MNTNQKNTIKDLSEKHNEYVSRYCVGNSSLFELFEDENGNIYVYSQKVTLRPDFTGVDYNFDLNVVDKAGFDKEVNQNEYEDGGEIEYLKKLKKINYND
jgi:hypothetical protein